MKTKKGFTLIELMVAMGIVAVLVSLSIVGIGLVQRSLRDTQRRDKLSSTNLALESYFSDNGSYPASLTFAANAITLPAGVGAAQVIPLSGATSHATGSCGSGNNATSSGTCYCFNNAGGAYSLAVKLESGGIFRLGTGTACTSF